MADPWSRGGQTKEWFKAGGSFLIFFFFFTSNDDERRSCGYKDKKKDFMTMKGKSIYRSTVRGDGERRPDRERELQEIFSSTLVTTGVKNK